MKFTFAALALAAVAAAQSAADIPACAKPCLDSAVTSTTKCSTTDYSCICQADNFTAVQGAATGCVLQKCGEDVALNKVLPAVKALCANIPASSSKAAAPTTTAAASTSAAATSSAAASSTAAASTTEAGKPTYSAPEASSTVVKTSTAAAGTTLTTGYATPTYLPPKPSTNGTATAPASTHTAPVNAGAATVGSLGAVALAALLAL